jgi:hypothetical protein
LRAIRKGGLHDGVRRFVYVRIARPAICQAAVRASKMQLLFASVAKQRPVFNHSRGSTGTVANGTVVSERVKRTQ